MKVMLLAGGYGTRLSEETIITPKPMIEIGGKPILWHIMKLYSFYGFNDFVILLGYKGYAIKEYFVNYFIHQNDIRINLENNKTEILNNKVEPWKITLIDTGISTMTGGRIKKAESYINEDVFMLTYGDGVSNVDIDKLYKFHKSHGKIATMTVVQPDGKYGAVDIINETDVLNFKEKPKGDNTWINGGFFLFDRKMFSYLTDDSECVLEKKPLEDLANDGELKVFKHNGFWRCMDTLRDKNQLNKLWDDNKAEWKIW